MGFQFGEMQTREQAPWAYDATNDLPKTHSWYPGLLSLDGALIKGISSTFPASTFFDSGTSAPNFTVPAGKTAFVTDMIVFSPSAKVTFELRIASAGCGVSLMTPAGGGTTQWSPKTPVKATAGQLISLQIYNGDTVDGGKLNSRVSYIVL